jgi:DnaJ-class molecular chaperone
MQNFKIVSKCDECDGGLVSDRHPIDPSSQEIDCSECGGAGYHAHHESFDSKVDAWADYPKAMDIIPL